MLGGRLPLVGRGSTRDLGWCCGIVCLLTGIVVLGHGACHVESYNGPHYPTCNEDYPVWDWDYVLEALHGLFEGFRSSLRSALGNSTILMPLRVWICHCLTVRPYHTGCLRVVGVCGVDSSL